ncbi:class I SAM-dependent methyltransferase [Mycetocola miduiensis]|uniref:Methyltransferase domain-containing protein n=1 Tax=Mycetocola miduiensis TaxID=995034 RepID=A0A1I5ACA4_9MICO|nr:class I SAM-dependent methyltransferase [Mycetocola miduiensis]SFN59859.1 Methyltransferase domain-containing protein [Mycetocola miduiensis]
MDETDDVWSMVSAEWAELWGDVADPVRRAILDATGIRPGSRVLDIGCGSGEFLRMLADAGVAAAGVDPAPGMIELARAAVPEGDIRPGGAESLPWPDASFGVVAAINALQFTEDPDAAVAEMVRVTQSGGFVAVANWAEGARNDIHGIEAAVARSFGEAPQPDGELRMPGGLAELLRDAGLEVVVTDIVDVVWGAENDDRLVRGVLLGEDEEGIAAGFDTVTAAARPFRTPSGGYRLVNAFRYAVGRTPTPGS